MDNRDGLENQLYKADWLKEVLQTGRIGMWIVEVDNETGEFRMYPDEQMHVLLGTEHMELTPKEQFAFSRSGLSLATRKRSRITRTEC